MTTRVRFDLTGIRRWAAELRALGRGQLVAQARAEVGTVYDRLQAEWPVRSGRSKAGIDLVNTPTGARIENHGPEYAGDVHRAGSPVLEWTRLAVAPMPAAAERAAERMAEVVEVAGGGR